LAIVRRWALELHRAFYEINKFFFPRQLEYWLPGRDSNHDKAIQSRIPAGNDTQSASWAAAITDLVPINTESVEESSKPVPDYFPGSAG
jgi:hypothetical protein